MPTDLEQSQLSSKTWRFENVRDVTLAVCHLCSRTSENPQEALDQLHEDELCEVSDSMRSLQAFFETEVTFLKSVSKDTAYL